MNPNLYNACYKGNYELLQSLVESNADVNVKYPPPIIPEHQTKRNIQVTLLHIALLSNSLPTIEYLIHTCGLSLMADSQLGTPILFAIRYHSTSITIIDQLIQKYNIDPKHVSELYGFRNMLHIAAKMDNIPFIDYALSHGIDIDSTVGGTTPLIIAATGHHYDSGDFIICYSDDTDSDDSDNDESDNDSDDDGADLSSNDCTSTEMPSDHTSSSCYSASSSDDSDTSSDSDSDDDNHDDDNEWVDLIHHNGYYNHNEMMNTNPNYTPTALYTVEHLIHCKANINLKAEFGFQGRSLLHFAVLQNNVKLIQLLEEYGADLNIVDEQHVTPLCLAIKYGHINSIKTLLSYKNKININIPDNINGDRTMPIHYAVSNPKSYKIVQLLFQHTNINRNVVNEWGKTLLTCAIASVSTKTVKFLLQENANVNECEKTQSKTTPLHIASSQGNSDIVQLLLQHNAKVDLIDINGETSLFNAIYCGHLNIVKLLLQYQSNIHIKRHGDSFSPLLLAARKGQCHIIDEIISHYITYSLQFGTD